MDQPTENGTKAIAQELFGGGDVIDIETVKAVYLPSTPSLQALVDDYESRIAGGDSVCIYRMGGMLILGPPIADL
jgi:hypothetical protein